MAKSSAKAESMRGALDLLVLRVLSSGALHGYGIARRIRELTDDALRIEEGSLYPALYRMERAGWVSASWGKNDNNRRVRLYGLTPHGERQLAAELTGWGNFTRAVAKVVEST